MSQPKGNAYTFGFAGAICLVCSIILAGAATMLKDKQVANVRHDIAVNIFGAVGYNVADLKKKPKQELFDLFEKEFQVLLLDGKDQVAKPDFMRTELIALGFPEDMINDLSTGDLLDRFSKSLNLLARKSDKSLEEYDPGYKVIYVHAPEGKKNAYVIPIKGNGLWDIIKGYVALDLDLNTIKGITFYEHKETPGLGARITEDWFKESYIGKKVFDKSGNLVSVKIAKGKAVPGPHAVDGISGATLTGNGINDFLKRDLARYEPVFKNLKAM